MHRVIEGRAPAVRSGAQGNELQPATRAIFSIGAAAEASGVSVKTIRYYEEIGLIPKAPRSNAAARTGGDRVYTTVDVGRLRFIRRARMLDLGLDDIRDLLALAENGCPGAQPEYRAKLERHLGTIEECIQHLLGLRHTIRSLLSAERIACGGAAVWTSCGCMGANESPSRTKRIAGSRESTAPSTRRAGGRNGSGGAE